VNVLPLLRRGKSQTPLFPSRVHRENWMGEVLRINSGSLAKLTLIRCAIRVLLTIIETNRMLTGVTIKYVEFCLPCR
jgi:hypothetical protein